jgi:hypothetical protein
MTVIEDTLRIQSLFYPIEGDSPSNALSLTMDLMSPRG